MSPELWEAVREAAPNEIAVNVALAQHYELMGNHQRASSWQHAYAVPTRASAFAL
jgi:hypothetical protein